MREAVTLGVESVMYDASRLDHDHNVARTAAVVEACHAADVWVEAELGEVGGKDGVHAPGARTDPDEARAFVAATGVDALAVAVGSSHAMTTRDAVLDLALISRVRAAVPVPLVLHGSSGVDDDGLSQAVGAGIGKVNLSTRLNTLFTQAVREHLAAHPEVVDPRKYVAAGRSAMADGVAHLLQVITRRSASPTSSTASHRCGMGRTRLSTTVDPALLDGARMVRDARGRPAPGCGPVTGHGDAMASPRTVAPCTTTIRGLVSEVVLEPGDDPIPLRSAVNLDSVESVSVTVLVDRLGRLASARMREICGALAVAVDCST